MTDTATGQGYETPVLGQSRRMNAATVMEQMSELLRVALERTPSEPWVTVEITDAAKGEVRVETKVSAPLGCDLEALTAHAASVLDIAEEIHRTNAARKGPDA